MIGAGVWFEGQEGRLLWEQAKVLGRTGRTLTYLVLLEQEG